MSLRMPPAVGAPSKQIQDFYSTSHHPFRPFHPILFSIALLIAGLALPAQSEPGATRSGAIPALSDRFSPYIPTPHRVVDKMLELANVGPDDTVYDLGSGDGRIVIAAAQKFGARAVGVEIRGELAEKSSQEIARLGLQKSARIIHDDMFEVNLHPATVVTLYQLTSVNNRLRPVLEKKLRPGARVVSSDFQIPGWNATKTVTVNSDAGTEYKLYLYIRD